MPFLLPQETIAHIVSYFGPETAATMSLQKCGSAAECALSMAVHTSSQTSVNGQMQDVPDIANAQGDEQANHRFSTSARGTTSFIALQSNRCTPSWNWDCISGAESAGELCGPRLRVLVFQLLRKNRWCLHKRRHRTVAVRAHAKQLQHRRAWLLLC
jgi:hypothetical protein